MSNSIRGVILFGIQVYSILSLVYGEPIYRNQSKLIFWSYLYGEQKGLCSKESRASIAIKNRNIIAFLPGILDKFMAKMYGYVILEISLNIDNPSSNCSAHVEFSRDSDKVSENYCNRDGIMVSHPQLQYFFLKEQITLAA